MSAVPIRDHEPAALRLRRMSGQAGWGILAWVVGIAFFLPVLWMVITAFKPESAAQTWPPKFVFSPTLAQFRLVFSGWGPYVTHSLIATTVSTLLVLLLVPEEEAVPTVANELLPPPPQALSAIAPASASRYPYLYIVFT